MVKRLVCGVGINDADYVVKLVETIYEGNKRKQRTVWTCPFHKKWSGMLERCYSHRRQETQKSYIDCNVCDEWLTFSNFKSWMELQDWEGKQLDKDLLVRRNKIYSPETCVFISGRINTFLTERNSARGKLPIGVCYMPKHEDMVNERTKPYVPQAGGKYLGYFSTPEEAHEAWLKAKLELAKELAAEVLAEGGDPRVAKAIVERYENYKESP